jgi:hypothetical protein
MFAQGKIDLNDNDMIVQATAAVRLTVLTKVNNLIKSARNTSPTKWQGYGITSSAAAAYPDGLTGLAAMLNDNGSGGTLYTLFDGLPVDINSVLIKFTWNGDADLSGKIDANDYFRADLGFTTGLTGYRNGDFDYNGVVDASDYFLIDLSFARQTGILGESDGPVGSLSVPEPASALALAAIATALGLRRRRSRE